MNVITVSGIEITIRLNMDDSTIELTAPPNDPGKRALRRLKTNQDLSFLSLRSDADNWKATLAGDQRHKLRDGILEEGELETLEKQARTALNMLPMKRRLNVAKGIMVGVRRNLNNSYSDCSECEAPIYENWPEHKMHLLVESTINRIEKTQDLCTVRDHARETID